MSTFYIGGQGDTIFRAEMDNSSGTLTMVGPAASIKRPTFISYNAPFDSLYACGETGDDSTPGMIARFAVNADGELSPSGTTSSGGANPCHIVVDAGRRLAIAANYRGGSVGFLRLGPGGELPENPQSFKHEGSSIHPDRQTRAYPHGAAFSPDREFAFVCDLGADTVVRYKLPGESGTEVEKVGSTSIAPGSGPRHIWFTGEGHAYLVNELSSTVTVFRSDKATAELRHIQTVGTLPGGFAAENTAAELAVHPNGRFVYVSNRGADTVVVYSRDVATGRLGSSVWFDLHARTPRHFTIDRSGMWMVVAFQDSDEVRSYCIDSKSGVGRPTDSVISTPRPTCVEFIR